MLNTEAERYFSVTAADVQRVARQYFTATNRTVLDVHGWGGLQEELNTLSKQGKWVEMGTLINDEILNTFAVVGEPETIASELHRRYGDVIQRISFYAPYKSDPDRWRKVLADLTAA